MLYFWDDIKAVQSCKQCDNAGIIKVCNSSIRLVL